MTHCHGLPYVQACIEVCPKNPTNFNVDNVRVVKLVGGGMHGSSVVKGVVIKRDTEGTVKNIKDAKVAVFAQGIDTSTTETKVSWAAGGTCVTVWVVSAADKVVLRLVCSSSSCEAEEDELLVHCLC